MSEYLQAVTWTIVACVAVPLSLFGIAAVWAYCLDAWAWMRETEYHRAKHRVAADMRYYSCWFSTSDDAMQAIKAFADELEKPTRFDMSNARDAWEKATGRKKPNPSTEPVK
jgi:hypothetical protein